jgi:hypothetical protein
MNKKSKRRAFFVFVAVSLLYVAVTFRLPEKFSMNSFANEQNAPSKGTIIPLPSISSVKDLLPSEGAPSCPPVSRTPVETAEHGKTPDGPSAPVSLPHPSTVAGSSQSGIEPSLLLSIPIISFALSEGWLDRDGLILTKKDAYNNVSWRKPVEILALHDEDGIVNILKTIGQKRMLEFLGKEGIVPSNDLSAESLFLGKGYGVGQDRLVALYAKYVPKEWDSMFPFSASGVGMAKTEAGYRLTKGKDAPREPKKAIDEEWMMPNLSNLPIRTAIEKLAIHSSRVKVYGNGRVMSQSPRPFERMKGEGECVVVGKAAGE